MTFTRLLLRNLRFHWRGNFAVLLGVAVGTAVLTGALLVGDSLRGSLRDLTEERLEGVSYSLVANRFFGGRLADEVLWRILSADDAPAAGQYPVQPAILLQGAASSTSKLSGDSGVPIERRAGHVTIWGVADRFWMKRPVSLTNPAFDWSPDREGMVLNETLARELGVERRDKVTLHLQKASRVPRETLLGHRGASEVVQQLTLPVHAVLPDNSYASRFSLSPNLATP